MVIQKILPVFQALVHLFANLLILNVIRPVKIVQVQMPGAAHPQPLGLEDEALALRVHNVERGLLVIEPVGKGFVDGVIDVLGIERPDFLSVPLYGAFYGIGPGPHVIQIGLGNREPHHRPAGGEVQALLCKRLPGVGNAFRFSGENQRQLRHHLIAVKGQNIVLRILCPANLLGNQRLKLRLAS